MTENALSEPSFADAAEAIGEAGNLPARTRSQWLCSLRQIAKAMDKPLDIVPARWTAARFPIERLHHARVGMNAQRRLPTTSRTPARRSSGSATRRECRAAACR